MRLETLQTVVPSRATNSCVGCWEKNYFELMCLPPTTLQDKITSSPSSIGPMVVLFIARPQRSMISMEPGKTEKQKKGTASAGNISWADVVIMIRIVVSSASWAIEFFLLENFSPSVMRETKTKRVSSVCKKRKTSWKHIHFINFNVEALLLILSSNNLQKSWGIVLHLQDHAGLRMVGDLSTVIYLLIAAILTYNSQIET